MARTTCRTPAPPGTVELLPSGRWRAFYRRDGRKFAAPHTFDTRADGHAWIAAEIADRLRGTWRDPSARQTTLADYAHTWLSARPDLAPRTAAVYRHLIERWVLPRRGAGRGIELWTWQLGSLLLAFALWGVASHAFGAVQDVAADRAAEISSIATARGGRWTVRFALACYAGAGLLVLATSWPGPLASLIALPYIAAVWPYRNVTDETAAAATAGWRRFLWINQIAGATVTLLLIWWWNASA